MKNEFKLGFAFYAMVTLLACSVVGAAAAVLSLPLLAVSVAISLLPLANASAVMLLAGIVAYGLCGQLSQHALDRWRASNSLGPYEW